MPPDGLFPPEMPGEDLRCSYRRLDQMLGSVEHAEKSGYWLEFWPLSAEIFRIYSTVNWLIKVIFSRTYTFSHPIS